MTDDLPSEWYGSSRVRRRTAWVRRPETPLRQFLRTETGSAVLLLVGTVAALVWANVAPDSYNRVWHTRVQLGIGGAFVAHDLRYWLSAGLMSFFFLVVGLEARREFDVGDLRERRRLALPLAVGIAGMLLPAFVFLAFNAGTAAAHGWGVAMSTDTAFALGMLAVVGPRIPLRTRAFLLTVAVVDDVAALGVISTIYAGMVRPLALLVALCFLAAAFLARHVSPYRRVVPAAFAVGMWAALAASGVDPIVSGLATGLLATAAPSSRVDLEQASRQFRLFREQPTPELARSARRGLATAISPNERLQTTWHPWVSYLIAPLFALANAGIRLNLAFVTTALRSGIVIGIVVGYLAGKPAAFLGATWLMRTVTRGRVSPPLGWVALGGCGAIAGIGFTISLLTAQLAFRGAQLAEAKFGVLLAGLCASAVSWMVFRLPALLPQPTRARALFGTADSVVDLAVPVDVERDHFRGPSDATVTLVEYGDFECPYCGRAEPMLREFLRGAADVRFVWRHLPLSDVHQNAQLAAEAAEAAGAQGAFWKMHDLLLRHRDALFPRQLVEYAKQLGLDVPRFSSDLEHHRWAARIAEDVNGADLSNVSGTPTFFINGRRYYGVYDVEGLKTAVRLARAKAMVRA